MNNYKPEGFDFYGGEKRCAASSPAAVYDAISRRTVLTARALMCDFDHNLIVDLGCMKGVIPRAEGTIGISEGKVKDIALISRVGKPVCFVAEAVVTDGNGHLTAMLSRRKAQEICRDNYISALRAGDIIDTKITHLEPFGAFCDIGCGIIALMPIDSVSVSRISHPSDRLSVGENIKAVVRAVDADGRITLSQKELYGTWEENAALFSQGQTVSGIVRSVESYGIFVELTPNLAGLAELKENVTVGQCASVYIKSLIPEKMKVKLLIIDSFYGNNDGKKKYFFVGDRIERWRYSPLSCDRIIETDFVSRKTDICTKRE